MPNGAVKPSRCPVTVASDSSAEKNARPNPPIIAPIRPSMTINFSIASGSSPICFNGA